MNTGTPVTTKIAIAKSLQKTKPTLNWQRKLVLE